VKALAGDGLRDMLRDDRVWVIGAVVALHEGESLHYAVNEDGDMQVTLLTHQHQVPITAILGGLGGAGRGVWFIPELGTEVLVHFPDGDFQGDATVVGLMPTRSTPAGLVPGKVFVIGTEVQIRDAGAAAAVAFKSDVQALRDYVDNQFSSVNGHVHAVVAGVTTTITTVATPGTTPTVPAPNPTGTTVLKAQ